jgi:hypothetical protein
MNFDTEEEIEASKDESIKEYKVIMKKIKHWKRKDGVEKLKELCLSVRHITLSGYVIFDSPVSNTRKFVTKYAKDFLTEAYSDYVRVIPIATDTEHDTLFALCRGTTESFECYDLHTLSENYMCDVYNDICDVDLPRYSDIFNI